MLLMRSPFILLTVEKSCYGVVNEPVSYFRNPSFPLADSVQNYCTYNAQVHSVCFKMGYDVFVS